MERRVHVQSLSDAELVTMARQGDAEAVGQLYDRHHERIFRYVWSRTGDAHSAEDLTSETFTRMVSNLARYRPTGAPFEAWLYRIARNLVVDHYRRESLRTSVPLEEADNWGAQVTNTDLENRLAAEQVRQALTQVDGNLREVVELRFLAGLSLQDVAQLLGKSIPAIKSLQHRGLQALRDVLRQD